MCSYLTSFFLPEDRWLWVPFRLTGETGSSSLRYNLIPWPDHELWCSWVKNQRHERYTIPSDTKMHTDTHTHTLITGSQWERQASTGIDCQGHWDRASMHQPISDSIRPLGLSVCFDHKQQGQQQQPQEAIHPGEPADGGTEWMTGSFQARPCCGHNTRGKGGSFRSGHTKRKSYVRMPHREPAWTLLL